MMISFLAQTTAPTTGPASSQPAPGWAQLFSNPIILLPLLLVLMMVMTSKSKKKQEKERTNMLSGMKRGDRVQTIGGVIGRVVEAHDNEVVVKVDESNNTKITFTRTAIHRVIDEEKSAADK